jgi:ribosome-associated heat shock protein Hsp15
VAAAAERTRVDRWLWAVRLTKTRSAAAEACRGGHVKVNDTRAKPSTPVQAGDTVRAHLHGRERIVEVVRVIEARVGAPVAAECLIDRSPPPPERTGQPALPVRDRGAGRPSKKERRDLDRMRGRR